MAESTPTRAQAADAARRPAYLRLLAAALVVAVGLAIATGGSVGSRTGYEEAARRVTLSDWWTLWAVPPVEVALIAMLAVALLLGPGAGGARIRDDGRPWVVAATALLLIAVCSPLAGLAQGGLLAAHMLQHVLIGAVAPILVLRALPRVLPGEGTSRDLLWRLTRPGVAFPLWLASTIVWLLPALHHQVLTHQALWVVQQVSFFAFGALLWAPVMERLRPAPAWFGTGAKVAYMAGVWFAGLAIGNVLWFSGTAFYGSHAAAAEAWGLSPLQDQANAGTVMVLLHCLISFTAIAVLFFRHGREHDLEERLLDAGWARDEARQAVRLGRAEEIVAGMAGGVGLGSGTGGPRAR
jgi:putative membrane protein